MTVLDRIFSRQVKGILVVFAANMGPRTLCKQIMPLPKYHLNGTLDKYLF